MPFRIHTFPFVPADFVSFWSIVHPNPKQGFILGSGSHSPIDHIVYLSLEEPKKVYSGSLQSLHKISKQSSYDSTMPRYVGYVNYEASRWFDSGINAIRFKQDKIRMPDFSFGEYQSILKLDFKEETTTLFCSGSSTKKFSSLLRKVDDAFQTSEQKNKPKKTSTRFRYIRQKQFERMVETAKEAIAAGDIYQANLSFRFSGSFSGSAYDLYRQLCKANPSPYACLLKMDKNWIVSCSPELLFNVKGEKVSTRPIAGTRPRGKNTSHDRSLKGQLLISPKEKAEHIMLVDLERNDIGKVSVPGSVHVTEKFAIEKYSHVMHIVSEVEGKLRKGKTSIDVLKALFPGGTISGCPKIRSIEIISGLEETGRGPFYGSAGFISWNGDATFNILIRTAHIKNKKISVQAGAGIVADSRPAKEYKEVLAKAKVWLDLLKPSRS